MKQDLNDLAYFVHVVDHLGFAAAGRALGEPKSKLSRRIAKLEGRLGVELIKRSTRRFSVTEVGQAYYRHCRAMLVEAEAAEEAIEMTRAEPCGIVRLTCPIGMLHGGVAGMLAEFMTQYPRVEIHLEATDRVADPVGESIDLAIRVRPQPLEDSGLLMRSLGERRQCIVASPDLVAPAATPKVPMDLAAWPSLGHGQPHAEFEWVLTGPEAGDARIRHRPRLISLDMASLRTAAVAGIGIVQLPHLIIRDELEAGDLIEVAPPDWAPLPETVHVVFNSRRGILLSVRTLIDFLVSEFEKLDDA